MIDQRVLFVEHTRLGRLSLTGRDRLALVNRMSTNNLTLLTQGHAMLTILTTPIGRMIDLLTVLHDGEQILVITGEERGERIRQYFQRNIFFNDQVKVTDASPNCLILGVYGEGAEGALDLQESLPEGQFIKQGETLILRTKPLQGAGFWLIASSETLQTWQKQLTAAGAERITEAHYDQLRIAAGQPAAQTELTEDYIPLEAGLWEAVSFNKGCYTGQEIIARLESRGGLAKMLVRLTLSHNPNWQIGETLLVEDTKVGNLTSFAPHDGGWVGLGYVKSAYVQTGQVLTTNDGKHLTVEGIVGTQPQH